MDESFPERMDNLGMAVLSLIRKEVLFFPFMIIAAVEGFARCSSGTRIKFRCDESSYTYMVKS